MTQTTRKIVVGSILDAAITVVVSLFFISVVVHFYG